MTEPGTSHATLAVLLSEIFTPAELTQARHPQLIEQAYRDSDVPNYEGSGFFMGDETCVDGSFVDPATRRHVADALKDEAAIAKERRKALEERKLRAEAKKPAK